VGKMNNVARVSKLKYISSTVLYIVLGIITLSGCTRVHIAGSTPSTSWHWGIININLPEESNSPYLVLTEGYGLVSGSKSTSFGWLKELLVITPDAAICRVFIVVETDSDFNDLTSLINKDSNLMKNICIYSKEGLI